MSQGGTGSARLCAAVGDHLAVALAAVVAYRLVDLGVRAWRGGMGLREGRRPTWRQALALLRPTTVLWALPFVGVLLFLRSWCALGLYSGSSYVLGRCCRTSLLCCVATLPRNLVCSLVSGLAGHLGAGDATADPADGPSGAPRWLGTLARVAYRVAHAAATVALLWFAARTAAPLVELPWNAGTPEVREELLQLELMLVAMAVVFAYFLFQQHGAGPAVVVAGCLLVGIAQYFVAMFKGAAIQPADLLALDTAAEVSGGYEFVLDTLCVRSVERACLAVLACAWVIPARRARRDVPVWRRRGVVCALLAAASLGVLAWNVTVPDLREDYGVDITYWDTLGSYRRNGFLPSFVTAMQEMSIERPEGYSSAAAEQLEADYADEWDARYGEDDSRWAAEVQFAEVKPSVVVVMNESFSDLSSIGCVAEAGYAGPTFLKTGLPDALAAGTLDVSVLGGGTCNSEFEFLTGTSMAFVGAGKYPYSSYSFSGVDTLVSQFADLGYETCAIHPNAAGNWHRNRAYSGMGFDEFLSIDDFDADDERLHLGIRDSVTYDKVIEVLEGSDEPQFVLDVTMQNHGGYTAGNTPGQYLVDCRPNGDETDNELVEYLSCINASDQDLAAFVERLRGLDRPVVLVFFGDHQPAISEGYVEASWAGEAEPARSEHAYQTCYLVWANYDVAGAGERLGDELACSELASMALQLVGAPMTDYQKAQVVSRDALPSFNAYGWRGADGTWRELDDRDGEGGSTLDDLQTMSYYEFGSRV